MTPNTIPDMILGFAALLGILLIYVISLVIRIRKAKK
jgi:hypothetical protein